MDRNDAPVTRMSYAVPEVRRHTIALFQEMLRFGADGVNVTLNRGYPLVLFEPAFREQFKERYGEIDPRTIPETDSRIQTLRTDIVTGYFHELRAMVDQEQATRAEKKHLEISVTALGNKADNLQYGVDLERLVNEGMIDWIQVYPWDFGGSGVLDMKFYEQICKPRGIPFAPSLPAHLGLKKMIEDTAKFYEGGAAGIAYWDAAVGDVFQWGVLSRLGSADGTLNRGELPNPPHHYYSFHILGTQVLDGRYPPYWGG